MICMKNLRFASCPRAKVRHHGPPGSTRAAPFVITPKKISHGSPRKWMSNFTRIVKTQVKFWKFHVYIRCNFVKFDIHFLMTSCNEGSFFLVAREGSLYFIFTRFDYHRGFTHWENSDIQNALFSNWKTLRGWNFYKDLLLGHIQPHAD